jgi:hypothetical protein
MGYRSLRLLLRLGVVLAIIPALAGLSPARASDGIDHVTLMQGELAPGAAHTYPLAFSEGPLRRGWLFALVGQIHTGLADLTLVGPDGTPAAHWRWEASAAPRWDGLALPADGAYRLRVENAAASVLRYTLYYDQSCFCISKKLPLEGGVILFRGSAKPGQQVEAWLAIPTGMEVSTQVAYRSAEGGRWPDDYRLVPATMQTDTQNGDTYRQESISFTADSPDPYYLIVEGRKGTGTVSFVAQAGTDASQPPITRLAPEGRSTALALAAAAALVALIVSLVGLLRLRRRLMP